MNAKDIIDGGKATRADIAKACGVTRQAVALWVLRNRIPLKYVKTVSEVCGIPCHKISPYFPKV